MQSATAGVECVCTKTRAHPAGELRLLYKRRRPNELCYCAAFNCRFLDNRKSALAHKFARNSGVLGMVMLARATPPHTSHIRSEQRHPRELESGNWHGGRDFHPLGRGLTGAVIAGAWFAVVATFSCARQVRCVER